MRASWMCLALMGCWSPDPRPAGTYTLAQTPTGSCSLALPMTVTLAVSASAPEVVIFGEYGTNVVVEPEGSVGADPNLRFDVRFTVYVGIVDSTPTSVTVTAHYDLWGDSEDLDGTASSTALSQTCAYTIEAS